MNNPKLKDVAQQSVVTIEEDASIQNAVNLMYQENHRDVIVISDNPRHRFGLLTANDLIRLRINQVDFSQPIKAIKYDRVYALDENASLEEVLDEISHDIECFCVTNKQGELTGVVFYSDVISSIDPHVLLDKRVISEILLNQHIKTAQMDQPTLDVVSLMDHHLNDCVLLFDANAPAGIITTKDVIKLFGEGEDLSQPVCCYMSQPIQTIKADTSIKEALDFIQLKQFKRLIVEDDDGVIIGQITQGELIARVYSRWSDLMRDNDLKLKEANRALQVRATKYEELSTVDHLTGVYNRAKFELELQKEIDRIRRYDVKPFSMLFFDVDHFKRVNDSFGHAVGDAVLQLICQDVSKQMRLTDIFARWGGEEFVAILPSTALESATVVAEKLRKSINQLQIEGVGSVSCSFGVGEFNEQDSFHSVILRTDNAMYQAKENGRNRVEVSSTDDA